MKFVTKEPIILKVTTIITSTTTYKMVVTSNN